VSLRDDVSMGLAALEEGATTPLGLDDQGACMIPVRIPSSITALAGGTLNVRVKLAPSQRMFTLLTPLAASDTELPVEVLRTLVADHFFVDRVGGASWALNVERNTLFASHHWMVGSISVPQFRELFHAFCSAAFLLLDRIDAIAAAGRGMVTLRSQEIG